MFRFIAIVFSLCTFFVSYGASAASVAEIRRIQLFLMSAHADDPGVVSYQRSQDNDAVRVGFYSKGKHYSWGYNGSYSTFIPTIMNDQGPPVGEDFPHINVWPQVYRKLKLDIGMHGERRYCDSDHIEDMGLTGAPIGGVQASHICSPIFGKRGLKQWAALAKRDRKMFQNYPGYAIEGIENLPY